jgi:hypothetical protein
MACLAHFDFRVHIQFIHHVLWRDDGGGSPLDTQAIATLTSGGVFVLGEIQIDVSSITPQQETDFLIHEFELKLERNRPSGVFKVSGLPQPNVFHSNDLSTIFEHHCPTLQIHTILFRSGESEAYIRLHKTGGSAIDVSEISVTHFILL